MTPPIKSSLTALMRLMADERIYRQENITIGVAGGPFEDFPNTGCAG